jgi:hypothetical protein
MVVENAPEGEVDGERLIDAAFSALTKTFGPVVQIVEPNASPDFWRWSIPSSCDHDWPGDLDEPEACCNKCHLSYSEYEQ